MLPPDLILYGGNIITLDRSSRLAQAVAVRSGRFVAVGDDAALLKDAAPTTQLIDLAGRSVLPGLFDAHPHADREGLKARGGVPIAGLHSVANIVAVVKRAVQATPAGEWVTGCLPECVSAMAAVPQIADDLLHRASQRSLAKTGCALQRLISADRCKAVRSDNPPKPLCRSTAHTAG